MSFLDDLKKEADQVKATQARSADSSLARMELVERTIQPRMAALYRYFKELKDHLEIVKPDLKADYSIHGYRPLSGLRQGGYRIVTDNPDRILKFTFGFAFSSDARHEFRKDTAVAAKQQKDYLWSHNLRFETRDSSDKGATFILEAFVPVVFEFEADVDKAAVRLRIRNLGELGTRSHLLDPGRIDQGLMDELAKCVLQKPNRFNELTGDTLSSDTRSRLREQIEAAKKRKELELRPKKKRVRKKKQPAESISQKFSRTFFGKK